MSPVRPHTRSSMPVLRSHILYRYDLALQALSHVLLLAPQNPFHMLHFAETAYLVPDVPLALKVYLQAVDMTDDDDQDGVTPMDTVPSKLVLRAWFGVKLVRWQCLPLIPSLTTLRSARTSSSPSRKRLTLHRRQRHRRQMYLHLWMTWLRSD